MISADRAAELSGVTRTLTRLMALVFALLGVALFVAPGYTKLSGTFCYLFPPKTDVMRAEVSIDSTTIYCTPKRKSPLTLPCTLSVQCAR